MTLVMNILGLLLVMLDDGVGSDVAKRIAAPMWGGLLSMTVLTLVLIPALYVIWRTPGRSPAPEPSSDPLLERGRLGGA